ncbi:tRNA pseudouridine(13) synthase TruD [Lentzea sp. NPDC004782]|uniref:tRNA pseudouridine(13) synthase TruD n=1 Tax=Lentzea sp. NPDC004782 TaxID=3154458 RepID=UPI0033BB3699
MFAEAVLKHRPSDFIVREAMALPVQDEPGPAHRYLVLRKCGYTTTEAIGWIAAKLGLRTADITFGGLKDEDGVTEQLIALPATALSDEDTGCVLSLTEADDRRLSLWHHGYGADPIAIGELEGNAFRVVVRDLGGSPAERFSALRKVNLLFLNYYDTQRFGVPGGPKRSHLVGEAMLAGDWSLALRELAGLGAPESDAAGAWTGQAKRFFDSLDPRAASFFLAAHSSHEWNTALAARAGEVFGDAALDVEIDTIPYRYARCGAAAAELLGNCREIPFVKRSLHNGLITAKTSTRASVVQTVVSVSGFGPDTEFPGRFQATLGFFLPSGCYATAAVRQLVSYIVHGAP